MSCAMPLAILPQGAQSLLLQDGLLRLAQIVIGALQSDVVNFGLMRGQRDVFA